MPSKLSSQHRNGQKPSKVPLPRRLAAYAIDWFVGDLMAAFPVVVIYTLVTGSPQVTSRLDMIPGRLGILAGVLSLICVFLGFVVIPWKLWKGQTIGKRLCGIRILCVNGSLPGLKELMIRQVFGLMLLEKGLLTTGRYLTDLLRLIFGFSGDLIWWVRVGEAFGLISCVTVLVMPSGRAVHDWIAGTRVASVKSDEA